MTVGEGAGAGVEDAKRYAGTNENELDMIFTFEHVNLGQTQYGKWSDGSFDLVELKRYFRSGRTDLKVWLGTVFTGITTISQEPCQDLEMTVRVPRDLCKNACNLSAFYEGTPYIYQGEELGMTNRKCRDFSEFRDIEIKNAYRDFVGGGILDERPC